MAAPEFTPIDATAAELRDIVLDRVQERYPRDEEAQQACVRILADGLRSGLFIRIEGHRVEKSRPRW